MVFVIVNVHRIVYSKDVINTIRAADSETQPDISKQQTTTNELKALTDYKISNENIEATDKLPTSNPMTKQPKGVEIKVEGTVEATPVEGHEVVDRNQDRLDNKKQAKTLALSEPYEWVSKIKYDITSGEKLFKDTAFSMKPITDKVAYGHHYDIMYGQFLLPFYAKKPNMKFLEIGLGCDMSYGPGASVQVWQKLFPKAELWEAEYNAACVEKSRAKGQLDGIHTLTGDQMDIATLDKWIEESGGGDFDVVVDDGGHKQCHIWTTFLKLWPLLKPGGLYFIEDLQVSHDPKYNHVSSPLCPESTNVPQELERIMDHMIHRMEKKIGYTDVKFIFCQRDSCVLGKHHNEEVSKIKYDITSGEKLFKDTAFSMKPITDKVAYGHHYDIMYGQFLLPFYAKKPNMKFLEIGLGCDMSYGPGASVQVWQKLFPKAELWEAEYNAACVEKSRAKGQLDGIHTLTGDQMDIATLDKWIEESGGGDFDVVVDDGGHKQCHIWTTFLKLWPLLKPGGLYFIEDLQVSHDPKYNHVSSPLCPESTNVPQELERIMDHMIHRMEKKIGYTDVKFIFCQRDSCVLGKHHAEDMKEGDWRNRDVDEYVCISNKCQRKEG